MVDKPAREKCVEEIYDFYQSETLIYLDGVVDTATLSEDYAQGYSPMYGYYRINLCRRFETLFYGKNACTVSEYMLQHGYTLEQYVCLQRKCTMEQETMHKNELQLTDELDLHGCMDALAVDFFKNESIALLDLVLKDHPEEPEYSPKTAYRLLDLSRQYEVLYHGRNIPDVKALILGNGYSEKDYSLLMEKCSQEHMWFE